jgi:hypothetical protein
VCSNEQPSFRELENLIMAQLNKSTVFSIPFWVAKLLAKAGDVLGKNAPINSLKLRKITESLTFSNEKAKHELRWQPMSVLENFKIE